MGKASTRRKERRRKYLTRLANENPEKFREEWEKRVESWLKHIQSTSRDRAFFTEREYKDFIKRFPHAEEVIVEPILRCRNGKVVIYVDRISSYHEDALGEAAYNEILKHVRYGTLRGWQVFEFVNRARKLLLECGDRAVELAMEETEKLLGNECYRALAKSIGWEIYRMNWNYTRKFK